MTIDPIQTKYADYDRYADYDQAEELMHSDVLIPGNVLVFTGASRIQKSHLMLSWLMHMAAYRPFVGLKPNRPHRIAYFQADDGINDSSLRERMGRVKLDPAFVPLMRENFAAFASPAKFDAQGMRKAFKAIRDHFGSDEVDIIAMDPVDNILACGENASPARALIDFLGDLWRSNPDTGVVLVHQSDAMRAALNHYSCTYVTMRQPQYGANKYQLILDDATVKDIELVNDQWREAKQSRYAQQTLNG